MGFVQFCERGLFCLKNGVFLHISLFVTPRKVSDHCTHGVVHHQGDLSLGWSLIRMIFLQGGPSSGWSLISFGLIRVVLYQGGLSVVSSGWYFISLDCYQGGLA